ncbi:unnamed protein product [Cyclocybe aegerita]|uniref:Uncharacterized protein n=1 Tax=Cyclocybe aegerita TaxID=1973307 RepID=A0A8S0WSH0_CYCAE|nr:unnamed protein product [Cyclocybe aegerita]
MLTHNLLSSSSSTIMKGFLTPIPTPHALSTGLNTPNAPGSSHYFALSHRQNDTQNSLYPQILDSQDLLDAKLASLESPCSGSPIDAMPNEILSLILEKGYFNSAKGLPDSSFRTLASHISHRFRDLTFHTPSLWSVIHLSPSNIFEEVEILPVHLERSKDHLLDIQLSCFWAADLTESVMDLLVPHSQRWRQLAITTMNDYIFSFIENIPAHRLQYLTISHYANSRHVALPSSIFNNDLPGLEYLCLRNVDIDNIKFSLRNLHTLEIRGYGIWPSFEKLDDMLSGSITLRHFILHVKPADILQQMQGGQPASPLLLPELDTMEVYTSEWLTEDQAALIRLFACPKLQSLVIRESVSSPTETAHTIMSYNALGSDSNNSNGLPPSPSPSLSVRAANFAFACLAVPAPSNITTLELWKVVWPKLPQLRHAFGALNGLTRLVISELNARGALLSIMDAELLEEIEARVGEVQWSVTLPSLQSLVLAIDRPYFYNKPWEKECLGPFLRLFSFPTIASLHIQGLTLPQWRLVVQTFGGARAEEYPKLTTLALSDMTDIVPTDPQDGAYVNLAGAFPHLQHLRLTRVGSNGFVWHLLPKHSSHKDQWPDLRTLSISGDTNASRPLLHRVIGARQALGCPLEKLFLDTHFFSNGDSMYWIRDRVEVSRIQVEDTTSEASRAPAFPQTLIHQSPFLVPFSSFLCHSATFVYKRMSTSDSDLRFDPGAPARKKRMSFCRCLLWTVFLTLAFGVGWMFWKFVLAFLDTGRAPHWQYYYKGDEKSANMGDVVRPLIDGNQSFDIMATVWLRSDDSTSEPNSKDSSLIENLVFSDIIFRGLRHRDRNVRTSVQYQVPTKIFEQTNLSNYDLRASFILLPTTSSLLDHALNYSTWVPTIFTVPPVRKYEPPTSRSLKDEIIDSFALTVPLLDFHHVNSACSSSLLIGDDAGSGGTIAASSHSNDAEEDDDDAEPMPQTKAQEETRKNDPAGVFRTTKHRPILESHPYVITKTSLRMIDMTKLYDRRAYNAFHQTLKLTACAINPNATSSSKLSWESCARTFSTHGNMETRIKLKVPKEPSGNAVQWAYAPYMSISPAWGPKYLVPAPVNRENCSRKAVSDGAIGASNNTTFRDSLDITWRISFSGESSGRAMITDALAQGFAGANINMTASELELNNTQFWIEHVQGLAGHKSEADAHPRRFFVMDVVLMATIGLITSMLEARYWYSLTSTVGISWPGTTLQMVSYILTPFYFAVLEPDMGSFTLLWTFSTELIIPFFMTKSLLRLEFGWWRGGYLPTLTFMAPTHGEKMNQRMNSREHWNFALAAFLATCGVYHFFQPNRRAILRASSNRFVAERPYSYAGAILSSTTNAAWLIGIGTQLWFNRRMQVFAGQYKAVAVLNFIASQLTLLLASPRVGAGDFGHNGFTGHDFLHWVISGVSLYQAIKYPTVQKED